MARRKRKKDTYLQRWRQERKLVQFFLKREDYARLEELANAKGFISVRELLLKTAEGLVQEVKELEGALERAYKEGYVKGFEEGVRQGYEKARMKLLAKRLEEEEEAL